MKKKQKSRRYKRYIRKQIKKALDERLFRKFQINKTGLPTTKLKVIKEINEIPPHNTWSGCAH